MRKTEVENLWLLSCGTIPPNPSELLGSNAMKKLHQNLFEEFDYIFYDTPPVIAVTDAVVLSTIVDSLALIIKFGSTAAQAVNHAKNLLMQVNTKVSGVVLNSVDIQSRYGSYDYYTYYHYYYSRYGKYGRYGGYGGYGGGYGYGYGEDGSEVENKAKETKKVSGNNK